MASSSSRSSCSAAAGTAVKPQAESNHLHPGRAGRCQGIGGSKEGPGHAKDTHLVNNHARINPRRHRCVPGFTWHTDAMPRWTHPRRQDEFQTCKMPGSPPRPSHQKKIIINTHKHTQAGIPWTGGLSYRRHSDAGSLGGNRVQDELKGCPPCAFLSVDDDKAWVYS